MKYIIFGVFALFAIPATAVLSALSVRMRGVLLAALILSTALGDLANINFLIGSSERHPRGLCTSQRIDREADRIE